jgi:hypothetical protein
LMSGSVTGSPVIPIAGSSVPASFAGFINDFWAPRGAALPARFLLCFVPRRIRSILSIPNYIAGAPQCPTVRVRRVSNRADCWKARAQTHSWITTGATVAVTCGRTTNEIPTRRHATSRRPPKHTRSPDARLKTVPRFAGAPDKMCRALQ